MERISRGIAASSAVPHQLFRLEYLANTTTLTGVVLAIANAIFLGHAFGMVWSLAWVAPAIVLLLASVAMGYRFGLGDASAAGPYQISQLALIATWMAAACAFWMTGGKGAWVVAVMIPASWAIHIIFAPSPSFAHTLRALATCTVPMMGFMFHSAWTQFPFWVAVAVSVSALGMLASIAAAAQLSHRNFVDLRQTLARADSTKARLQFAIRSAGDGYFEVDFDRMEATIDESLARIIGAEGRQGPIELFHQFVHPDERDLVFSTIDAAREGAVDGWKQEIRVRMANGDWCWMQLRAQAIAANPVDGRKLIGTVVDMTASKDIERELRAARDVAEASSSAKSQFLANMSHEIRTPLNGVLGMAQALEADDLSAAQKEKVAVILDSGKSLMALLNDVLDLTKIEAGKLEIAPAPGDFLHTMKRTRQLFQAMAEEKGLDLLMRYDSGFPQRLVYDPTRVRQCVSNLLSNAIKFTAQGRVEVAIGARPAGEGNYVVTVEVVDTGIGIAPETQARLFSVFTQADGATTRKFGGSGLGLAISRQLARMMGGDIMVASEPGRGSTFTFTFRAREAVPASGGLAAPSQTRAAAAIAPRSLRGLRVLLTDDNAINRQVIKLFLAPQGCDIVEATNGKEALDLLARHAFDIVLLDIHMPVMDGKETIQRLRAEPRWKDLPVIALTADAMSGDREKYLALGMSDYVSKPVDQRELIAKMHVVKGWDAPAAPQSVKRA